MKIGFCVKSLNSGHKNRGVGRYTELLLEALRKHADKDTEIVDFSETYPNNVDLIHYPFFDPFFVTMPYFRSKPSVVTVHDLIPLIFTDKFPRGLKGEIKWQIQKSSLLKSRRIITDSNCSKNDIVKILKYNEKLIDTVYLSADNYFLPLPKNKIEKITFDGFELNDNFFLYVGDINWNKNVKGLLKSFSAFLKRNHSSKVSKMILVGEAFQGDSVESCEISQLINNLGLENDVLKIGKLQNNTLCQVYNLATAYIQPSFYEGFGLPVLEALACGCVVLSSDKGSLKEVGGDAVWYFDPENIFEQTALMEKVAYLDFTEKIQISESAVKRANEFSWKKTATETLLSYQKAIFHE